MGALRRVHDVPCCSTRSCSKCRLQTMMLSEFPGTVSCASCASRAWITPGLRGERAEGGRCQFRARASRCDVDHRDETAGCDVLGAPRLDAARTASPPLVFFWSPSIDFATKSYRHLYFATNLKHNPPAILSNSSRITQYSPNSFLSIPPIRRPAGI
ncbi:hypothetical protein EI94DRAFT_1249107 [Lactarius quietus]|nr:hypothetical protein EI94DRAFT_1249107 [Lactarius quietus]